MKGGASWAVIALGWLLLAVAWQLDHPYSTVLSAAAAVVLIPEAVRGIRHWRHTRAAAR